MKNVTPYSLDDEAVRSDAAVSVISSIGLTAVIVWADLLGHGFGFAPSSSIIQQLGNARLFFLVGFTLCAIGSVLLARAPQRKTQVLTKAAPTAAFLGTGLYGFAYLQTALPSEIIALLGLVCCGAGYYATTLLIYCELAKTKRLVMAIGALSASLILKTIVGSELSTALTSSAQVVFASISALGLLRVPGGAQALRHITLSRSIPLSPTFDEKRYVRPRVSASSRIVDTGGSERHQPSWTLGKQPFGIARLNSGRLPHSRPRFDCLRIPHPASQQQ